MEKAESFRGDFVRRARKMSDFRYDEQQEKYWDVTTGNLLGGKSVDGAIKAEDWPMMADGRSKDGKEIPVRPSIAINNIDSGLTCEGSTWWPGKPQFIENVVVSERGAMSMEGAVCYNSYIPPGEIRKPKGIGADKWIQHVKKLYPAEDESEHFFDFCAHMIQRPNEKINHGLVMAGSQGIGKDTALLPIRRGVGEWNAAEIGPEAITSTYNGHVKSVLLVINEVRPHDEDFKASNFYNMLKPLLASPPEMLPMTLKYANTIYIRNLCHVVLTTNDPLTMYIPAEDRRLFVMTSPLEDPKISNSFTPNYFEEMYDYFTKGGEEAVVHWLRNRDINAFNPATPPPMTRGKKAIIESAHQVRRSPVDDVFESYCDSIGGKPTCFFPKDLISFVQKSELFDDVNKAIGMIKAKNFHFKMAERGYDMVRHPWKNEWVKGKFRSRTAFVDRRLSPGEQIAAAEKELEER